MARIVIAGRSDCTRYAKAEAVADQLQKCLPEFKVHKIVVKPEEWEEWLAKTCKKNIWRHSRSPMVWRELVDRGGKGLLIGDENHFQEYARAYYNIEKDVKTELLKKIALENLHFKQQVDDDFSEKRKQYKPYTVCLTNVGDPLAYHLIPLISRGVFGERTQLEFRLADPHVPPELLEGIKMEIEDMAVSQLREVNIFHQIDERLFSKAHMIILLEEVAPEDGESKRTYLQRVAEFYRARAKLIGATCIRSTRVVVAASRSDTPLNFILNVMREELGSLLNPFNLVGIPRLFENEARHLLAEKLGVLPAKVNDVAIWGNIASQFLLDVRFAKVYDYPGAIRGPKSYGRSVSELIWDKRWLNKQVQVALLKRNQEVSDKCNRKPKIALANAISGCLRDWLNGLPMNATMSNLVVCSDGSYGIPTSTFFCFPVRFNPPGYWCIYDDIQITPELQSKLDVTLQSIKDEFDIAFGPEPVEIPPPEEIVTLPVENANEESVDSKLSQIAEETESQTRVPTHQEAPIVEHESDQALENADTQSEVENEPAQNELTEDENDDS